jgi:hypothetical protein
VQGNPTNILPYYSAVVITITMRMNALLFAEKLLLTKDMKDAIELRGAEFLMILLLHPCNTPNHPYLYIAFFSTTFSAS